MTSQSIPGEGGEPSRPNDPARRPDAGDSLLVPRVLGVLAGFATSHVTRLQRRTNIGSALCLVALVVIGVLFDSTPFRAVLALFAAGVVVAWLVTSGQLLIAKRAIRVVGKPIKVVSPDEARDLLAQALGLPGLTPWPLVRTLWKWQRSPEVRATELPLVIDRLKALRSNPDDLAMLFTAVPE